MKIFSIIFTSAFFASISPLNYSAFGNDKMSPSPSEDKNGVKILFLGDSITAGYGIEKEQAYPQLLSESFASMGMPIEAINAGIDGLTSARGPDQLKWHLRSKPDILVLELGGNDALRGLDLSKTKENLQKTIKMALDKSMLIVLVGMTVPQNYGEDYRKQFAKLYSELAKDSQVYFVPLIEKFLGQKDLVQSDAIHPNAKGHEAIAKELAPHLKPLIEKIIKSKPKANTSRSTK